jgi:hypothetical protein
MKNIYSSHKNVVGNNTVLPNSFFATFIITLLAVFSQNVWGQNINASTSSGGSWSGTNPAVWTPSGATWNVNVADITSRLASGNVTINGFGSGNVIVQNAITYANTSTNQFTLTIDAGGDITISQAINLDASVAGGSNGTARPGTNLTLNASNSISISAAISCNGNIRGNANGAPGGSISLTTTNGNISISQSLTSNGSGRSGNGNNNGGNAGNISINSALGISLSANITATGGDGTLTGTNGNGGNITISNTATTTTNNSGQSAGVISANAGAGGSGGGSDGIITKNGSGLFILGGNNTYTGSTVINAGILRLSSANRISDGSNLILNGGTFSTGSGVGFAETLGTLQVTENSTIELGMGNHTLTFSNSSGVSWTANKTLTITGWLGSAASSGTAGKIFFDNTIGGLVTSQATACSFSGYSPSAGVMLSSGELVPSQSVSIATISPSTYCSAGGETVTITGSAFTGATSVTFNGVAAASFSVTNSTTISAVTPANVTAGVITVTTPAGSASSVAYTVASSPGAVSVTGGGTVCNSATLTASGGIGGTIYWQNVTSNGTSLLNPSTSQTVSANGTYYFRAENNGCWGPQGSATVTLASAPTTLASSVTNSAVTGSSATISWTNGNGNGRLVVVRPTSSSAVAPLNGTTYNANTEYGQGSTTGANNFVVFASTGNTVQVSGLASSTQYAATVYEYNAGTGCILYASGVSTTFTTTNCPILSLPYAEGFNGSATCWTTQVVSGTATISLVTTGSNPTCSPSEGSGMIQFNSYTASSGASRRLVSPTITTNESSSVLVSFDWHVDPGYASSNDEVRLQYSTNGGVTWIDVQTFFRHNATAGWTNQAVTINTGITNNLKIGFLFTSRYGNNCHFDNFRICAPPQITTQPVSPSAVCVGQNTSFSVSATGSGSLTYQWRENGVNISNGGIYSGATSTSLSISAVSLAMSGNVYTCVISNSCGNPVTTNSASLTVNAAPTASAGGSVAICGNATATVSGASASNGTILWTHNGTGSLSNTNTLTPTYTPGTGESGTVTLTMTVTGTNAGCTATTATANYTVTVNPNPSISLGASPVLCQGTTSAQLPYTSLTGNANQYSITFNAAALAAGFINVSNATISSSPISIAVPAGVAANNYSATISVRNSVTGCTSVSTVPFTITVNNVNVSMAAAPQVCQGITTANVAFTILEGAPSQYTLDFDATAEAQGFVDIATFTSFSNSSIAVNVPNNPSIGTYNGTIIFRNPTTGCQISRPFSVVVTQSPQVSNLAVSSAAICAGFGNEITVTSSTLLTGVYTVTYNVSGANTANDLTATLNFTAGSPGTGTFTTGLMGSTGSTTLTVTELTSGCSSNVSSGNTTTYTVNASPSTPTASYVGAGTGVCEGSALTLSASGSSGTYTWSGPNAYSGNGAAPTVSSSATTAMAGTYTVFATNNGCQSQPATTNVVVNTVGITLGANPVVCSGVTAANLPYSAVFGAPNQYSIDFNAAANTAGFVDVSLQELLSGAISIVVPANAPANTYSGNLTVTNTTNGCTSATVYPISITINALPTLTLAASPTVCRGSASANLIYNAQTGANEYEIIFDSDAQALGFTNVAFTSLSSSPVSVNIPTGAPNGTYNAIVRVRNSSTGCVSIAFNWSVTLTSPDVSASAFPDSFCSGGGSSTISATGANSYVWNTGATSSSFVANVNATTTYTVTGTRTLDGCTAQASVTVAVGAGSVLYSSTFENSTQASGWTGQNTAVPTADGNYWAMGANSGAGALTGWWTIVGVNACTDGVLAGTYSPRIINYKASNPNSGVYCNINIGGAANTSNRRLFSPSISSSGYGALKVSFKHQGQLTNVNNVKLQYSLDNGLTWTDIKTYNTALTGTDEIELPAALNNVASFRLGFALTTNTSTTNTTSFVFDDFVVTGILFPPTPATPTGTVTARCTNSAITNTYNVAAVNGATSYVWAISPIEAGTISGAGTTGTVTWANNWTGTAQITVAAVNCSGTGTFSNPLNVTISSQANVTIPTASQTVCANQTPQAISVTTSGGSGTNSIQWYSNTINSTSGGTLITGANGLTYTPPASSNSGSTFFYAIVSNNGASCVNSTSPGTVSVTVNPIPQGTSNLTAQSICSGQTSTQVNLSTSNNVAGTTFTWTRDKITEVTGIAPSGSGNTIAASTLTNTTLVSQSVVFTITPTGPTQTNCVGDEFFVSITVTPGATVNAGSLISICDSDNPSAITLSGASIGGSATDAAWSITSGLGTLSSTVSNPNPASITFTPNANTPQTVVLTLTTNDPDGPSGGCLSVSDTRTIVINPNPTVTIVSNNSDICVGENVVFDLSGTPGSEISFNINGGAVQLASLNAGTKTISILNATNNTTLNLLSVNDGVCTKNLNNSATVNVYPQIEFINQSDDLGAVCTNGSFDGNLSVEVSGGGNVSYQWYRNYLNSNVGGDAILGATSSTFAPLSNQAGFFWYYCVVSTGSVGCEPVVSRAMQASVIPYTQNPMSNGDFVWTGAESSDWLTVSNWYQYNNGVYNPAARLPQSSDVVVIPQNSICYDFQPIVSNNTVSVKEIIIEQGGAVTLGNNAAMITNGNVIIQEGGRLELGNASVYVNGSWYNNGEFIANEGSVTFTGGLGNDTLFNPSTFNEFYNLVVNKSNGELVLGDHIKVKNELSIAQGDFRLNQKTIDLDRTGFISNEGDGHRAYCDCPSAYIRKVVDIPTYTTINPGNLGLTITTSSKAMGETVIKRRHQRAEELNGVYRIFDVTPQFNGNLNLSLEFQYFTTEVEDLSLQSTFAIYRSTDSGGSWNEEGGFNIIDDKTVIISNWNEFSWITLAPSKGSPLPVELLDFKATSIGRHVQLDWTTVTEINNEGFEVERSADGLYFEMIGWVEGNGNSTVMHQYQFTDEEPFEGVNYYRLRQVDFDNRFAYSKIVSVVVSERKANALEVNMYPNPATGILNIDLVNFKGKEAQIRVFSIDGRMVFNHNIIAGENKKTVDVSGFSTGTYLIQIQSIEDDFYYENKLIVVH